MSQPSSTITWITNNIANFINLRFIGLNFNYLNVFLYDLVITWTSWTWIEISCCPHSINSSRSSSFSLLLSCGRSNFCLFGFPCRFFSIILFIIFWIEIDDELIIWLLATILIRDIIYFLFFFFWFAGSNYLIFCWLLFQSWNVKHFVVNKILRIVKFRMHSVFTYQLLISRIRIFFYWNIYNVRNIYFTGFSLTTNINEIFHCYKSVIYLYEENYCHRYTSYS